MMTEADIAAALRTGLSQYDLTPMVRLHHIHLHILLNRPQDVRVNYPSLARSIYSQLATFELSAVSQVSIHAREVGQTDYEWEETKVLGAIPVDRSADTLIFEDQDDALNVTGHSSKESRTQDGSVVHSSPNSAVDGNVPNDRNSPDSYVGSPTMTPPSFSNSPQDEDDPLRELEEMEDIEDDMPTELYKPAPKTPQKAETPQKADVDRGGKTLVYSPEEMAKMRAQLDGPPPSAPPAASHSAPAPSPVSTSTPTHSQKSGGLAKNQIQLIAIVAGALVVIVLALIFLR